MKSSFQFREWLQIERIVPLVTALSAFIVDFLGVLGIVNLTLVEGVFLLVLGLLATDALVERLGILSRIERKLVFQKTPIWEEEILQAVPLKDYIRDCSELFVSGGHLYNLLSRKRDVLADWLRLNKDATLKLILENPVAALRNKTPISTSEFDDTRETYAGDIKRSLRIIKEILNKEFPGRIEIRLTDQVPSVTVMMVDREKARVFVNLFKGGPEQRPVFEISKNQDPEYFKLIDVRYRDQLWKDSKPYDLSTTDLKGENSARPTLGDRLT